MLVPRRCRSRPRITLGQVLASVAVAAVPIAPVMRALRATESALDLAIAAVFCTCAALLFELFFWGFLILLFPPLHRALGRPSWFLWEVEVNPEGIAWVEERGATAPTEPARPEDIRWVE